MYHSCIDAIKARDRALSGKTAISSKTANVFRDKQSVDCDHEATRCRWVGNDDHYACLHSRAKSPQRVYHKMNGGKQSRF